MKDRLSDLIDLSSTSENTVNKIFTKSSQEKLLPDPKDLKFKPTLAVVASKIFPSQRETLKNISVREAYLKLHKLCKL